MLTRLQFHCHNLIHEDHEMMAALNVTALSDLGYDEKTRFIDPMEPRYRAKPFADADFVGRTGDFSSSAIQEKVKFFNNLDAYRFAGETEEKLEAYWKTKSLGGASSTTSFTATSSTATTLATSTSSGAGVTTTGSSTSTSQGSVTTTKSSSSSTKKDDDKKTSTTKSSSSSSKKKDDDDKKTTTSSSAKSTSATTTAKTTTTKK
jgi:bilirubin oxidase